MMPTPQPYTAVVLAAQRGDADDPLAPFCDRGNKCLIDISGRPMINWVLATLLAAPEIGIVLVSTDDHDLLDKLGDFDDALAAGRLRIVASGKNLFASVATALREDGRSNCPAIITTADNPLLTPDMITHFCRQLAATGVDAAIAMTRAEVMRAEYPDGQRRFYAFTDGEYSNCNLYAIVRDNAVSAAGMFKGGGQFRKKAMRIIRAFGISGFVLYRLRLLSLTGVGDRLSRVFGARIGFVTMPFAEACIDVDNERTLLLAREILAARSAERGSRPAATDRSAA